MQITAVSPRALAAAPSGQLRVGQFNVENFFDTVDDPHRRDTVTSPAAYQVKLQKLALAVRDQMGAPDVVTLEEVEGQQVLDDLLLRPELAGLGYRSIVMQGNDLRGINVAMLYRAGTISITKAAQANMQAVLPGFRGAALPNPGDQVDPALLFARPPLVVDAVFHAPGQDAAAGQSLTFIINHFKSKMGGPINDARREQQAAFVAGLVDARTAADPGARVLVTGDLNTGEHETAFANLARHADGSTRLTSATAGLAEADRYSWGKTPSARELFDHILLTGSMQSALTGAAILHINTSKEGRGKASDPSTGLGVSDHDPIVATFLLK
ncbi:MAG: hypothetical protein H7287_12310 [Thermoleophilia bacterium]|nr:hypothetical protein [Thermoleophilia bacterium]